MGTPKAQDGREQFDDCFERREQARAPGQLLSSEPCSDGGEIVGQHVQVDARVIECPEMDNLFRLRTFCVRWHGDK
jgi:hypothetical protein